MCVDEEAQEDELLALSSIYEDQFSSAKLDQVESCDGKPNPLGGELRINVEIPEKFHLIYENYGGVVQNYPILHLSPVVLNFHFPPNYPSQSPPQYMISCQWLTRQQLSQLCLKLDALWEENHGMEVMFTWSQFIKDETLPLFDISENLNLANIVPSKSDKTISDNGCVSSEQVSCAESLAVEAIDPRAIQNIAPNTNLFRVLREYDEEIRQKVFNSKIFECKVCFLDKNGANSLQFWPCSHIYCRSCMKTYFEIQINEGNIKLLKCPEDKCNSEANPKQVEELVSEELYRKWDELLLTSTLSAIEGIQLCPRMHCQYPVTVEENQGQCPACSFVFCGLCRFGWHGLERCKFQSSEAKDILEKYRNGCPETKKKLEDRYGRKYLRSLLDEYLSFGYLKENTKDCPKCKSSIEKVDGCNKMTCKLCGINFCWLCERILDHSKPYIHFNDPKSHCFNRLFEGAHEDEEEYVYEEEYQYDEEDYDLYE